MITSKRQIGQQRGAAHGWRAVWTTLEDLHKAPCFQQGSIKRLFSMLLQLGLACIIAATVAPLPAAAETPVTIDMKLLVISADGTEPVFAGIKSVLDQIGVPYDTLIASQTPLTPAMLSNGSGAGKYQGILLATGNLGYASNGGFQSALTQAQWEMLWAYEADFRVRQVTLYTYPAGLPDTYGLNLVTAVGTNDTSPLGAKLSTRGKQVFSYLNPAATISIRNAYTYLATPISTTNPAPLLSTPDGYAIASIYTYPNGRQNMAITADGNPDLTHTLALGYGIVNWVSKGLFLGQRMVYMSPQPDDMLIADDIWDIQSQSDATGLEYRLTGNDYTALVRWQNALRAASPITARMILEMPFNGVGASGIYPNDTLTPAVTRNPGAFRWISHTYSHELLTAISYSAANTELSRNNTVAKRIPFGNYFKDSMVQPEISGLANPEFLRAARDFGIRFILSDTSQPGWGSPSPNTGIYSTYQPGILIIPRYPTNLYYNVTTPAEWTSEYNHFYAPGRVSATWDHALSYAEILDKESEIMLHYLMKSSINPLMFHQSNLRAYDGKNSLLGDLINATLVKYMALYNLPIQSQSQHDLGVEMAARMAYNKSGAQGRILVGAIGSIITVSATAAAQVPFTGIAYGLNSVIYGGQRISRIPLSANGSASFFGPAW